MSMEAWRLAKLVKEEFEAAEAAEKLIARYGDESIPTAEQREQYLQTLHERKLVKMLDLVMRKKGINSARIPRIYLKRINN